MTRQLTYLALKIETWLVAPYKKPLRNLPENETFNMHVSRVWIRSEHAIGYFKGRFQSLKGLRVNIKDRATHHFACSWVVACIAVHSYALLRKKEERDAEGRDSEDDPFIQEGLSDGISSDDGAIEAIGGGVRQRLLRAQVWREKLKRALFRALDGSEGDISDD